MNERMIRFIELLNQMFELDKSDLDFGIYRILNIRRKEIQKFFTEGLPRQIRETLEPFAQGNKDELRKQIAEIEQQAAAFGASPENNPKYKELKAQLQQGTDLVPWRVTYIVRFTTSLAATMMREISSASAAIRRVSMLFLTRVRK